MFNNEIKLDNNLKRQAVYIVESGIRKFVDKDGNELYSEQFQKDYFIKKDDEEYLMEVDNYGNKR